VVAGAAGAAGVGAVAAGVGAATAGVGAAGAAATGVGAFVDGGAAEPVEVAEFPPPHAAATAITKPRFFIFEKTLRRPV
jgi:hypothetical protein